MPTLSRKGIRLIGAALMLLSFYYVYRVFAANVTTLAQHPWTTLIIIQLGSASLVMGGIYSLQALAWSYLALTPNSSAPIQHYFSTYAVTGIYKYLPGNLFHFVGRNVVGGDAKAQLALAAATLFEIGLSLLSATTVASAGLLLIHNPPYPKSLLALALSGALLTMLIIASLPLSMETLRKRLTNKHISKLLLKIQPPPLTAKALITTLLAYTGMAAVAVGTWNILFPATLSWPEIAALYIASWLVGYVVPGAPGGLGVREAFLVLTLSRYTSEANVLLFAVIMRLIATLADIHLLALGKLCGLRKTGLHSWRHPQHTTDEEN